MNSIGLLTMTFEVVKNTSKFHEPSHSEGLTYIVHSQVKIYLRLY